MIKSYDKPTKQWWKIFSVCSNNYTKPWSIGKNPQRIRRIRPFIDQCDWKDAFSYKTKRLES